ncbi:hypothetical protein WAI453_004206 [Rhynchosporium graminicola]
MAAVPAALWSCRHLPGQGVRRILVTVCKESTQAQAQAQAQAALKAPRRGVSSSQSWPSLDRLRAYWRLFVIGRLSEKSSALQTQDLHFCIWFWSWGSALGPVGTLYPALVEPATTPKSTRSSRP